MMPGFMIRKELEMVTKETTVVNGMKGQERDRIALRYPSNWRHDPGWHTHNATGGRCRRSTEDERHCGPRLHRANQLAQDHLGLVRLAPSLLRVLFA